MTSFLRGASNYFDKVDIDVKGPCYKFQNMRSIYFFVSSFSSGDLKIFKEVLEMRKDFLIGPPNVMQQSI